MVSTYLVSIVARIVFVRIAAFMLDGDNETIVPLDPSLRGTNLEMGSVNAWRGADHALCARV